MWEHYGLPPEQTAGLNAQMFCSFLDGTKSAVEMAAVANATGLVPQARGLGFPACGTARPGGAAATGARGRRARPQRHARSRLEPARRTARPLPATCAGACTSRSPPADRFVAAAFAAYGLATSGDGRVAALWRPSHLVGLELGVSVARAALAGEPTGAAAGCDRGGRMPRQARSAGRGDDRRRGRRARLRRPAEPVAGRSAHACCRWDWPAERASCATSRAAARCRTRTSRSRHRGAAACALRRALQLRELTARGSTHLSCRRRG